MLECKCPFCLSAVDTTKLLFARINLNNTGAYSPSPGQDDRPSDRGLSDGETEREPLVEKEQPMGRWIRDDVHSNFLRKYMYFGAYKERSIFLVAWATTELTPGVGRVTSWEPGEENRIPGSVMLCEEDQGLVGEGLVELTTRLCPHCHNEFLPGYLCAPEDRIRRIALIGGSRAGKTQYLTAMYQNTRQFLDEGYDLGSIMVHSSSKNMMDRLSQHFESDGRPPATRTDIPILPIVLRIRSSSGKDSFLSIYDCPGEIFNEENPDHLRSQKGLKESSAVLMIIDCAQLFPSVIEEDDNEYYTNTISSLLEPMRDHLRELQFEFVSVAVTKLDRLLTKKGISDLGTDSPRRSQMYVANFDDMSRHKGAVDLNEMLTVSNEIVRLIDYRTGRQEGKSVSEVIRDKIQFGEIMFFGVSTFAHMLSEGEMVNQTTASNRRHRLLEPLLYLMVMWDMIEKKKEVVEPERPKRPIWKRRKDR